LASVERRENHVSPWTTLPSPLAKNNLNLEEKLVEVSKGIGKIS